MHIIGMLSAPTSFLFQVISICGKYWRTVDSADDTPRNPAQTSTAEESARDTRSKNVTKMINTLRHNETNQARRDDKVLHVNSYDPSEGDSKSPFIRPNARLDVNVVTRRADVNLGVFQMFREVNDVEDKARNAQTGSRMEET